MGLDSFKKRSFLIMSIVGMLFSAAFFIINVVRGSPYTAALNGVVVLCVAAGLVYFLRSRRIVPAAALIIICSVACSLAAIVTMGPQVYYWIYVWPPIIFFFLGKRLGAIFLAGLIASVAFVALNWGMASVGNYAIYDFIGSVLLLCLISYLAEHFREGFELKLASLSHTDQLTGLHNRRSFEYLIRRELGRSRRSGAAFCLVLLDLDHFKAINDTFGHARGDEALVLTAALLSEEIRTGDYVARWGGEEFIVLAPQTERDGGVVLAEKLRAAFARISLPDGPEQISASFGVAESRGERTFDQIRGEADRALYAAKAAGRNCVRTAPQD